MSNVLLLVCEGETDIYVFETLVAHLANSLKLQPLAPQQDATSGTYPAHGYGDVINWCIRNNNTQKLQMFIDFIGAQALFIQIDTDIALKINPNCTQSAKICCEERLNQIFNIQQAPERCYYVLPIQNTETWLLASLQTPENDNNGTIIENYELITNTEERLINRGYPSKKGVANKRKLKKNPAKKYEKYANQLIENLSVARARCNELDKLCNLLTTLSL